MAVLNAVPNTAMSATLIDVKVEPINQEDPCPEDPQHTPGDQFFRYRAYAERQSQILDDQITSVIDRILLVLKNDTYDDLASLPGVVLPLIQKLVAFRCVQRQNAISQHHNYLEVFLPTTNYKGIIPETTVELDRLLRAHFSGTDKQNSRKRGPCWDMLTDTTAKYTVYN